MHTCHEVPANLFPKRFASFNHECLQGNLQRATIITIE
jgi:hypothetical protein